MKLIVATRPLCRFYRSDYLSSRYIRLNHNSVAKIDKKNRWWQLVFSFTHATGLSVAPLMIVRRTQVDERAAFDARVGERERGDVDKEREGDVKEKYKIKST